MRRSAERAGESLRQYRDLKIDATRALVNARSEYWSAANRGATAAELEPLRTRYLDALRDKDFACLTTHVQNQVLREGQVGLGDILGFLSGGEVDGGIPGYAEREFKTWANSFQSLVGSKDPAATMANIENAYGAYL